MPFPDYNFADTADGTLDAGLLHREIEAHPNYPFSSTFQGVASGGSLDFVTRFDGALTGPEESDIDGVVAAHIGTPTTTETRVSAEDLAGDTTTSETYVDALVLDIPKPGTWDIRFMATILTDSGIGTESRGCHMRCQIIDGGTTVTVAESASHPAVVDVNFLTSTETFVVSPQQHSGFVEYTFTDTSTRQVKLQWRRRTSGQGNAIYRDARMIAETV